jgi:hypothetical protein
MQGHHGTLFSPAHSLVFSPSYPGICSAIEVKSITVASFDTPTAPIEACIAPAVALVVRVFVLDRPFVVRSAVLDKPLVVRSAVLDARLVVILVVLEAAERPILVAVDAMFIVASMLAA